MEKNISNRFEKISNWIIGHIISVMILFCCVSFIIVCFMHSFKHPEYLKPYELLYLLPVGIIFAVEIFFILKSSDHKYFIFIWSAVFILQSAIIILWLNSPPQGDGGGIFKEAVFLSQGGNFPFEHSNYFYNCYWLMWTVYVEKIIIDLFGVGYGFFKVMGTICLLGSGLILYRIVSISLNERSARIVFGLYVLFSPISLCVSYFSHQHIAFFLLILSIYLMWSKSWYRWALAGFTCGLMNGFRPWGMLLVLAVFVYFTYCVISKKCKFWQMLLLFTVFFVIYKVTGF